MLRLALPADELAILELQVNFAGALEFSKPRLYFFASTVRLAPAVHHDPGRDGAAGRLGGRRELRRLRRRLPPAVQSSAAAVPGARSASRSTSSTSRSRGSAPTGYFAVTTNTVQFGAHYRNVLRLLARCRSRGRRSFDALIQFSPFHFTSKSRLRSRSRSSASASSASASSLALEGPTPWHVHGTASISLLFFSIEVPVDVTWGDSAQHDARRRSQVMPILTGEFGKRSNWKALLPSGSNLLVSLRQLDAHRSRPGAAPGRHAAGQPADGSARPHARQSRQPEAERRQPFRTRRHLRRADEGARAAGTVRACAVPGSRRRHEAVRAGLLAAGQRHRARLPRGISTRPARRSRASSATT